jgi:UDP-glucose 4-epimerase
MKILITGAAGFIGSNLANYFDSKGHELLLLDDLSHGSRDHLNRLAEKGHGVILKGLEEISDFGFLRNLDAVIHLAGISSLPECESEPDHAFNVNTLASMRLINGCMRYSITKFIFASTSAVYENSQSDEPFRESLPVAPDLVYSSTKIAVENYLMNLSKNYGYSSIICRFFNVYGPNQNLTRLNPPYAGYVLDQLLNGISPVIYNTKDIKRDYIYITDLCLRIDQMLSKENKNSEIYNICSGQGYSPLEIFYAARNIVGSQLEYTKGQTGNLWNRYPQLFNRPYPLALERVTRENEKHVIGSTEKISNEFGEMQYLQINDGLRRML